MLVAVRGKLQALIDQGMTEDEVVAARPTAEFDAAWGRGFMNPENFTRFSYQSLKK
jgi:cyclase